MSIVERILEIFNSYAFVAQGWNPQEEDDYQDFVDAVGNALAPAEQGGRVDEGMVDRMIEEYRRLEPEDSKLMEISTTDGETRDFCRSLLQAALAQNAQRGAVADRPAGFGIACTVTWTELHAAMTADGMTPPNKCGKAMSAWIGKVVRDYLHAERVGVPNAENLHELVNDWRSRVPLDETDEQHMRWATYRQCADEIAAMLAAAPSPGESA